MNIRILCLLAALIASGPALAREDHDSARRAVEEGRILPLSRILERVEAEHRGQMVGAELEDEHGRMYYEIKLLNDDGRLTKLFYDAQTGEPLPWGHGESGQGDSERREHHH